MECLTIEDLLEAKLTLHSQAKIEKMLLIGQVHYRILLLKLKTFLPDDYYLVQIHFWFFVSIKYLKYVFFVFVLP